MYLTSRSLPILGQLTRLSIAQALTYDGWSDILTPEHTPNLKHLRVGSNYSRLSARHVLPSGTFLAAIASQLEGLAIAIPVDPNLWRTFTSLQRLVLLDTNFLQAAQALGGLRNPLKRLAFDFADPSYDPDVLNVFRTLLMFAEAESPVMSELKSIQLRIFRRQPSRIPEVEGETSVLIRGWFAERGVVFTNPPFDSEQDYLALYDEVDHGEGEW